MNGISAETYYFVCFLLGVSTGYWALFVSMAAEQFGTNIRSTTANTIPNFVRGSVNLIMPSFRIFNSAELRRCLVRLNSRIDFYFPGAV